MLYPFFPLACFWCCSTENGEVALFGGTSFPCFATLGIPWAPPRTHPPSIDLGCAARPGNLSDALLDLAKDNPETDAILVLPSLVDSDAVNAAMTAKLPKLAGPIKVLFPFFFGLRTFIPGFN